MPDSAGFQSGVPERRTSGVHVQCRLLRAAFKIVFDVLGFRLRKLEMANLAAALSIMLALRLPFGEVIWRTLFALLLNVFVYLNNDYLDVTLDARSPDKHQGKIRFLREHMRAALGAQLGLLALLVTMAIAHSPGLLVTLVLGAGICVAYSKWLKHIPVADVLAMTAWGFAMPLAGTPLNSILGLALAIQLGLFSSVFESTQVICDHDADRATGVHTTAVVLGIDRTMWLIRLLILLVAVYAALVLHPMGGAVAAGALLIRRREGQAGRYWTTIKLVYGIAWLAICAWVFFQGQSQGLLWQIPADATIEALNWTTR